MLVEKKTKKGEGLGGLGLDCKLLGFKGVTIFIAAHNILYIIMKNAKENFKKINLKKKQFSIPYLYEYYKNLQISTHFFYISSTKDGLIFLLL